MAAGLTSIPFSYLSAANAAKGFNAANAASTQEAMVPKMGSSKIPFDQVDVDQGFFMPSTMQKQMMVPGTVPYTAPQLSPMDIMLGKVPEGANMVGPTSIDDYFGNEASGMPGYARSANPQTTGLKDQFIYAKQLPGEKLTMPSADIFTKAVRDKAGDVIPGEFTTNFLPTAVSQAAGLYAGRDTPEEEFEAAKRRRRKELAFLYGVDESLIEGEMDMGGNVSGPGGPKDDMIDAKLSDGEFVMTAKAVENFGNGDRYAGAKKMYQMMNKLDPESETMSEV